MAENTAHIAASRQDVWAALADGWRYTNWVVGTSHMRAVTEQWPAAGAKLFHAVGIWPLVRRDETEVDSSEPGRRLVLIARGRPFGEARIVLELSDEDGGCLVRMVEEVISGPATGLLRPVIDALLHRRNDESLARFAALVEQPAQPAPS